MPACILNLLVEDLSDSHRTLIKTIHDPAGLAETLPISGAAALDRAGREDLVFCKKETPELVESLLASEARCIVARPQLLDLLSPANQAERVLVLTGRPRLVMALLLGRFDQPAAVTQQREAIHPEARIDASARLGPGVVIGADVQLGPNVVVGPNSVIDHCTVGPGSRIGSNCTLGGDGFGYEIDEESGDVIKFPHFGRIQIGADVEIGSNTCVDRGSLRDTVIREGAKVDNLVHIAHNCDIGRGAIIIANAMIGGSSTVGDHGWVAPSASLINGVSMGRCALAGLGAVVTRPVGENDLVAGVPAKKLRARFPDGFPLLVETVGSDVRSKAVSS